MSTLHEALRNGWLFLCRYDRDRVIVERRRGDGLPEKALAIDRTFQS